MKKLFFVALLSLSTYTYSQFYFDAGIKAGYGMTILLNKNIFHDSHVVSEFSFDGTYGGKVGLNFNEKYCLAFDIMYSGFKQSYSIKSDSLALRWNKTIRLNTLDIAMLFRNYSAGTYFEIGPQLSLIKTANENSSISGKANTIKNYESSYYAAVIGFGANMMGSENVTVMIGFRATYALTDIISNVGGRSNVPAYPLNETYYKPSYTSYKPSQPLAIRFLLEVNFDLGYFTHSKCNKNRVKFITF